MSDISGKEKGLILRVTWHGVGTKSTKLSDIMIKHADIIPTSHYQ